MTNPKVVHVMKTSAGGAARAGLRLHDCLKTAGVDSRVFTHRKTLDDSTIVAPTGTTRALGRGISWVGTKFDLAKSVQGKSWGYDLSIPTPYAGMIKALKPDLINLHWLGSGFLTSAAIGKLADKIPTVWTIHDMRPFSGGCHYDEECGRYRSGCGNCPQLKSPSTHDLSAKSIQNKTKCLQNVTIVSPSRWLADCARQSTVFQNNRVEVIPYGIDSTQFRPIDTDDWLASIGIPSDAKIILFGADNSEHNTRKGFDIFLQAVELLRDMPASSNIHLLMFGTSKKYEDFNLPFPGHCLGYIGTETLIKAYSAADVFVMPSRQDNLPNTVLESMACGTPVVAFNIGGVPDMVDHKVNGFLATPFSTSELQEGIRFCLESDAIGLSQSAREKIVSEFSMSLQAERYTSLYQELINRGINSD